MDEILETSLKSLISTATFHDDERQLLDDKTAERLRFFIAGGENFKNFSEECKFLGKCCSILKKFDENFIDVFKI